MSGNPHVLLIEDNPGDARLIREWLSEAGDGFELEWVDGLATGTRRLRRGAIDAVLLDLSLPESQGLDTFNRLYTQAPHLPIIVLTGLDDSTIATSAVRAGAQDYLLKGQIDGHLLSRSIRYAIERKRVEELAARRAENLKAVNELAIELAAMPAAADFFAIIAERMRSITDAFAVVVSSYDPQTHELTVQHITLRDSFLSKLNQLLGRDVIGMQIPVSPEMLQYMLATVVATSGDLSETTFGTIPQPLAGAIQKALNIREFTGLALLHQGELLGSVVIAISNGQPSLSLETVEIFAHVVSVSLRRKHADEALRKTHRALKTLSEFNQMLVRAEDESALLRDACRVIVRIGGYRFAWVGVIEPGQAQIVHPVAQAGCAEGNIEPSDLAWAESERGTRPVLGAIRTCEPSIANNLLSDADFEPWRAEAIRRGYASMIALPLLADAQLLGALVVYAREPDAFNKDEATLMTEVAGDLAYGMAALRTRARRARAEESVRESEARYRNLVELSPDAILLTDLAFNVLAANDQTLRLLGYDTAEEITRKNGLELIAPEEQERLLRDAQKAIEQGIVRNMEYRALRRDNTCVPVELSGSVVTDADGTPRGFIVVARDITERKKADERIRHNAARAEALARVAARLNAQLDLPVVLNAVCEESARALNLPAASVGLYDATLDAMVLAATFGLPPNYLKAHRPIPRQVFEDHATKRGPVAVLSDVQSEPGLANSPLYTSAGIRTVVMASLMRENQVIGGLNLYSLGEPRTFAADELALLHGLADQAAQAILNAQLFAASRRHAAEMTALHETAVDLASHLETPPLLETIIRRATDLLGGTGGVLYQWDPAAGQLRCASSYNLSGDYANVTLRSGEGVAGRVYETSKPLIVNDYAHWEGRAAHLLDVPTRAVIGVPILHGSQVFGVLNVNDESGTHAFDEQDIRLLNILANQAGIAMENARLFADATRRLQHQASLHTIDVAITSSLDLGVTLNVILEQIIGQLGADAVAVLLRDPHLQTLDYTAARGFRIRALQHTHLRVGQGFAGKAVLERRVISIPNLNDTPNGLSRSPGFPNEGFISYHAVPLIAKGQVRGVLEIFHRVPFSPDAEWLGFLGTLGTQVAIAIDNASLFKDLQDSNTYLAVAYDATIEGWSRALDLRDKETEGHTERVTEMTERLALAMSVSESALIHFRRGALLHDIGKMGIPDAVLLKPGALTDQEWEIMRQHPSFAYELLSPIPYLGPALDIPYCHHEKWDGTGYPRGLKGEQIPLAARIFAVVDVWDALRSDRPYRPAWAEERVRDHIREQAGKHFDPLVVETFLKMVTEPRTDR